MGFATDHEGCQLDIPTRTAARTILPRRILSGGILSPGEIGNIDPFAALEDFGQLHGQSTSLLLLLGRVEIGEVEHMCSGRKRPRLGETLEAADGIAWRPPLEIFGWRIKADVQRINIEPFPAVTFAIAIAFVFLPIDKRLRQNGSRAEQNACQ